MQVTKAHQHINKKMFINFISGHDAAICALESDEDRMVSSDDLGNIIVWQAGDRFKQILRIKGDG